MYEITASGHNHCKNKAINRNHDIGFIIGDRGHYQVGAQGVPEQGFNTSTGRLFCLPVAFCFFFLFFTVCRLEHSIHNRQRRIRIGHGSPRRFPELSASPHIESDYR